MFDAITLLSVQLTTCDHSVARWYNAMTGMTDERQGVL